MKNIGTIEHPVKLLNNEVVNFKFDYFQTEKGRYAVAYMGEIHGQNNVLLRMESACIFGHVFDVVRCDCQYQLAQSMLKIAGEGKGLVIYAIDQDARGLGIEKHFEIYVLRQHEHLETKEVYEKLNRKPDEREYDGVIDILKYYKITSVRILTNNPQRLNVLEQSGIQYEREPLEIVLNNNNTTLLMDEKKDLGYLFSFKTHDEWFSYLRSRLEGFYHKQGTLQACVITSDYKEILAEEYDADTTCCHTLKRAISKIPSHSSDLKAYIIGTPCSECISAAESSGISKIHFRDDTTKLTSAQLSSYGVKGRELAEYIFAVI